MSTTAGDAGTASDRRPGRLIGTILRRTLGFVLTLQRSGAAAYAPDLPLERMLRDVRMFQIGGGTSQAQMNMIARSMFAEH